MLAGVVLFAGMIGYGMAKAAVHHLVQSLKNPDGGLPPDSSVLGILPYDGYPDYSDLQL